MFKNKVLLWKVKGKNKLKEYKCESLLDFAKLTSFVHENYFKKRDKQTIIILMANGLHINSSEIS